MFMVFLNNFKINQTNFNNFKMKKNIKNFDIDIRNFEKLNKVIKKN